MSLQVEQRQKDRIDWHRRESKEPDYDEDEDQLEEEQEEETGETAAATINKVF